MTRYRTGYEFERRVHAYLLRNGYEVVESRGSHGPADLIAGKVGQLLLVQCKRHVVVGDTEVMSGSEWNELWLAARRWGGIPVIADRPGRGKVRLRRITGPHRPRSREWPCLPMLIDEVAGR